MRLRNTPTAYGSPHKVLHWLMSSLITCQFIGAWIFINLPKDNVLHNTLFQWHALGGLTIFTLVIIRILWRANNPRVLPPPFLRYLKRLASQSTHLFLYFAMVLMPVSGYLMVTTKGHVLNIFGLTLPALIHIPSLSVIAKIGHIYLAYFFLGAIALHALTVFMYKGGAVLKRML
jgi:cytochrome b561